MKHQGISRVFANDGTTISTLEEESWLNKNSTKSTLEPPASNPPSSAKEMRTSFLEYSMSVIMSRALPDVRDGLERVHRRILYAMYDSGITPNRPHSKSARTVGDVIGKYHPHGDSAVYDTMVRSPRIFPCASLWSTAMETSKVLDGDSAAAMRYTEARLAKPAMELLRDLEKETVDWRPNYDESLQEPEVLPARSEPFGSTGRTVLPSAWRRISPAQSRRDHRRYVSDARQSRCDHRRAYEGSSGPDFPRRERVMGRKGIIDAYETGRGSLTIRAKHKIVEGKNGKSSIVITEIPYQVNRTNLMQKLGELIREKKLPEISNVHDGADRNSSVDIIIELKQNAIPQVVLNKLYKHTQLQVGWGVNMLALVDGVPHTLSLKEMLFHYIKHQEDVIIRRTRYDLRKAEERAHILEGLLVALDNIDEVIAIIRGSQTDKEASAKLIERFNLSRSPDGGYSRNAPA